MSKVALTPEQKENFKNEFSKIIEKSTPEIQKRWLDNSQIIFPIDDNPIIESGVQKMLSPVLKDKYVILLNKLKDRQI